MLKPFLKWAGGKYRILKHILPILPNSGNSFVEPFAGSAVVWLNTQYQHSIVCDLNADLIALFQYLQKEGEKFIKYCESFFNQQNNSSEAFYDLREKFNNSSTDRVRAALLLYLNRHCFNGLIRYNADGEFNTPFGQYKQPYFPANEMLEFYQKSQKHTKFLAGDFRSIFDTLKVGDIVYCDPPYVPLSETASFTTYTGNKFLFNEQIELAERAYQAALNGVTVIISNHDTQETRKLYQKAKIIRFSVQRNISCKGQQRQSVSELLAVFHAQHQ